MIAVADLKADRRRRLAELGAYIQTARLASSLDRNEVARRMGYRSIARGAWRVSQWDKGEDFPRGDRPALLAEALGIPLLALERRVAAVVVADAAIAEQGRELEFADQQVRWAERTQLAHHLPRLWLHREAIRAWRPWRDVRLPGAQVALAYIGGQALTLGALLLLWEEGLLTLPCERCGGTLRVLYAAGSPLSGGESVAGICVDEHQPRRGHVARAGRSVACFIGEALQRVRGLPAPAPSEWSLGQVLAALGYEVDDVLLHTTDGELLARYVHATGCLHGRGEAILRRFDLEAGNDDGADPQRAGLWSEVRGPAHIGGRIVIGQIQPLVAGAWRGEQLRVEVRPHRHWTAHPGWLEDERGRPVVIWGGALPPVVVTWLVRWLYAQLTGAPARPGPMNGDTRIMDALTGANTKGEHP